MARNKSDYGPSRRHFLGFGLSAIVLGRTLKGADEPGDICPATGEDIEGPFWQKDAPFKSKLRLEKHAAGEPGALVEVNGPRGGLVLLQRRGEPEVLYPGPV